MKSKSNMKFYLMLSLSLLVCLIACKTVKVETTVAKSEPAETINKEEKTSEFEKISKAIKHLEVPEWSKNAVMYEVNVRQYSEAGTFKAVQDDLPRLKALGVDILWLMPIHPIGEEKRKGSLGSYYAVKDYKAVNPMFGTQQDFNNLVAATHQQGMYLIIDWVPNHTAWDNTWITEHPNWYTQDKDGNIIDPTNPETGESWGWTDVADLNYENTDMRNAMIEAMKYWVIESDIDGFRCDVAHSVPVDFWYDVKTSLDKVKPLFMLAEAEKPVLHQNGFHASYAWNFHHRLNKVAKGEMTATDIRDYLIEDAEKHQAKDYRLNFTSNHDENSWSGTVFERMGNAHKCLAALTFVIPGMPLLYNGQEAPLKKRLAFFEKDAIDWNNYAYADFYSNLNQLKKSNPALWNGSYGGDLEIISTLQPKQVLALTRKKGATIFAALFNLSDKPVVVEIKDDDTFYNKTGKNRFELNAWGYKFFE